MSDVETNSTVQISHKASEAIKKSSRYDRQLRLWGDRGQNALESAHVCLINATALGTEILKNLVLPGIGSITIVDSKKTEGSELGQNFFLDIESLGAPRAERARLLLLEMNEEVKGEAVISDLETLISQQPSFFQKFSVVIASQLPEVTLLPLSRLLWSQKVPLVVARAYGFIGYIRVAVHEHCVTELKPDNSLEDLRFDKPFNELTQHVTAFNLESMGKAEHEHVPYLILIFKYLQAWSASNGGAFPIKYKEKSELKELLRSGVRINPTTGGPEIEENFDEAIHNLNTALVQTKIPSEVLAVLNDNHEVTAQSSTFWILVKALKRFVQNEGNGQLPLRGTIPDMTSSSKQYIDLQNVYRHQAKIEALLVMKHTQNICQEIGISSDSIPEQDVFLFCKNAYFIRVLRTKPLEAELSNAQINHDYLEFSLDDESNDVVWYVLLRAVEKFRTKHAKYPTYSDVVALTNCVEVLFSDWGLSGKYIKQDYILEMCRYSACELHSIAAFTGGLASQECIKIITQQYLPINNTFIYNGIKSTTLCFEA